MCLIMEEKQVVDESFSAACPLLSLDLADAASRHCGGSARQSQGVSKALKQKMLRQSERL